MTITEPTIEPVLRSHVEPGLDVRHLSGAIGSVIRGLDVRHVDDETIARIRSIWLERKVVFFPNQNLGPDEHVAFARRFGDVTEGHPVIPGIEGRPEVFEIDYSAAQALYASYGDVATRDRGIHWHTDVTFVKRPPLGSILRAVVVPESGGDTLFSNQAAAFAGLSPSLREYLRGLTAVHDGRDQFQAILDVVGEGRRGRANGSPRSSRSSIRWCASTPRRARRRCSSTRASPHTSSGSTVPRATHCWSSSTSTRSGRSTPSATSGAPGTSASGTTVQRSTRWSATSATSTGSSTVSF